MKKTIFGQLLVGVVVLFLSAGAFRLHAQTQSEMNAEAAKDFLAEDARLDQAYRKLEAKLDRQGQEKLKLAQRAWVTFRDAEADLQADSQARGGTMANQVYETVRADLTKARTKDLGELLKNATGN